MTESIRVCLADYANPSHALALVNMLDDYARDPMGGGEGLSDFVKANLAAELARVPGAFSVLAFDGESATTPVGLVNCLQGFSTFACKPLVNVHDVAVIAGYRGRGIAERMFALVEEVARQRGACKLTLEVLSSNVGAVRVYTRVGFAGYALGAATGEARFMQKYLA
jgi:ribosomal protein S18 acetylase RimI-like enzyme